MGWDLGLGFGTGVGVGFGMGVWLGFLDRTWGSWSGLWVKVKFRDGGRRQVSVSSSGSVFETWVGLGF